jgi:hypothetical protein
MEATLLRFRGSVARVTNTSLKVLRRPFEFAAVSAGFDRHGPILNRTFQN